jgi:sugar phosphate isomerase/epimerase
MYHIAMTQWIVGNEDIETSCRRLEKYGYDGIEFAAEPRKLDAEACTALMKKYSLDCRSLCGIFDENRDLTDSGDGGRNAVAYLKDNVDFAVKVGAKIIIVVPSPVGRTAQPAGKTPEELRNSAVKNIREAADYAREHGVKIAVEAINRYETYFMNTLEKAYSLVKEIDHPTVGIMADLFHMSLEERSLTQSLLMIQDKLLHVHIADNTREPAGLGRTDFKEVLLTLGKIGYSGSLTMEFMYRLADPYSSKEVKTETGLMDKYAKQAIDYIKMIERSTDSYPESHLPGPPG